MADDPVLADSDPAPAVDPAPAPAVDPAPAPDPAPADPAPEPKNSPWFLRRISEESSKRQQAEERAAAAERKAQEAIAMAQRLQAGKTSDPAPQPTEPKQPANNQDFEAAVARAAEQRVMTATIDRVVQAGYRDLGKSRFDQDANIIAAAAGQAMGDFMSDVLAVSPDGAHKLIHLLAADPEKAAQVTALDRAGRIAELIRMDSASKAPPKADPAPTAPTKPAPVSRAPAPKPPIDPVAPPPADDWMNDNATDEEFAAGYAKKYGIKMVVNR